MNIKEGGIAYMDGVISEEDLPLKYVFYPGGYGAFFAFSYDINGAPIFCECSKSAIENYVALRLSKDRGLNANSERQFLLDSMYFPQRVIQELMEYGAKEDESIIDKLRFHEGLCHVCNKRIPKYEYCHEMYGGKFKRMYGWYINAEHFRLGIDPIDQFERLNLNDLPDELMELFELIPQEKPLNYWQARADNYSDKQMIEIIENEKAVAKILRKINNYFDNLVRLKLGYKKVGEGWVSETDVFYIVKNLFPKFTVIQHYRPKELEGLELDIFMKEMNLGIEYQGIQHFKAIKHWGGEEGLKKVKDRDKKKRILCEKSGIKLIHINFDENVTSELVKEKISPNVK
jgi:hypothetical protein